MTSSASPAPASPLREQQLALDALVRGAADDADGLLRPRPSNAPALLGIYRHAYRTRLAQALSDNHEVLARALGDDTFEALARAYIEAHPSRFASIRWFGDKLADFMLERDDLVPHPAFADLARMDWALRGAFDAADAAALGREPLAALPAERWPGLRFTAHPSVAVVPLQWAVEAAWRALREYDREGGGEEPELPEPQALPHDLLVWRQGLETRWRSLEEFEAAMLRAALQGDSFAALCERALASEEAMPPPEAAMRAAALLHQWVGDGLFGGVTTEE